MTNHPNRNWRKRWTVDLSTCSATHAPTGVIINYTRDDDGWEGKCQDLALVNRLLSDKEINADQLARIMREAGDVYKEALDARQ